MHLQSLLKDNYHTISKHQHNICSFKLTNKKKRTKTKTFFIDYYFGLNFCVHAKLFRIMFYILYTMSLYIKIFKKKEKLKRKLSEIIKNIIFNDISPNSGSLC